MQYDAHEPTMHTHRCAKKTAIDIKMQLHNYDVQLRKVSSDTSQSPKHVRKKYGSTGVCMILSRLPSHQPYQICILI